MLIACVKKINKKVIKKANQQDAVELREDILGIDALFSIRKKLFPPIIVKLNKRKENEILQLLSSLSPDFIDLDSNTHPKLVTTIKNVFPNIKIIISYHDFEKTPDLEEIFQKKMQHFAADIYKLACYANSSLDSLKMLLFLQKNNQKGNFFGISMGEKGVITRIVAPLFKSASYASIDEKILPCQIGVDILEKRYNYKKLHPKTSIFALLGDPVTQSPSHRIHNKIFSLSAFDAVYVKIPLSKKELPSFLALAKHLPFQGFSVTMPLKEEAALYVDALYKEAKKIDAINTIWKKKNQFIGGHTDGIGALNAIEKREKVKGKTILLIGAGGAAKAIAIEAKKRGAFLMIMNRNKEKAVALAEKVQGMGGGLEEIESFWSKGYDILIYAVSKSDLRLEKYLLEKKIIMDINMDSFKHSLLQQAKQKNCRIIHGFEMFIFQAKEQLSLFSQSIFEHFLENK